MVARIPSDSPHKSSLSSRQPSDGGDGNDKEKKHDYQMYAQKLNNNAAMCIEVGYYDKATHSLQRALNFYQKQTDRRMVEVCPCEKCEVDGNIDFSADFRARAPRKLSISSIDSDDEEEYICKPKKSYSKEDIKFLTKSISNPKLEKVTGEELRRHRGDGASSDKNANWSIKDEFCEGELEMSGDDEDLIYKRPIRVERLGHPMGGSLFLIITFNLALTHHLEAAAARCKERNNDKSAKKALLFYELTSTHERRLLADSTSNRWDSLSSIRFNTILNSNLLQLLQYLREGSSSAAEKLLSSVSDSIAVQTETLGAESLSRSRHSRSPSRWPNDDKNNSKVLPRSSVTKDYSDSSTESSISRSSKKSTSGRARRRGSMGSLGGGSNHSRPGDLTQRGSIGRGSPSSTIRLQNALGDMAPSVSPSRNSAF